MSAVIGVAQSGDGGSNLVLDVLVDHRQAGEVSGCVDNAVAVPAVLLGVGGDACEFDADHEGDGVLDGELVPGHGVEQFFDFVVVVEWVAVGVLAWPVDQAVCFGEYLGAVHSSMPC